MQVTARAQAWYWGIALAVLFAALWGLGDVLLPYIIGAGVAYMLDPLADRLERLGLSRTWAVTVITLVMAILFAAVLLLVAPIVIRQGTILVETAPQMLDRLQNAAQERFPDLMADTGPVRETLRKISAAFSERMGTVVSSIFSSVMGAFSMLALVVIVPVVAFYLLLDWDRMMVRIDALLPRPHAETIRGLAREIDEVLGGFLRGQGTVILVLAIYYATSLFFVGLPGGVAVGIITASLSFIPYIGALIGGVSAIGLALFSFWGDWIWVGAVVAIFIIGQLIEGNILVPLLVGGHIGLHPLWLFVALSVFGALFGFPGMLVAVPLAATVGVIVRFLAEKYKESAMYTGKAVPPMPAPPMLVELVERGTAMQQHEQAKEVAEVHATQVKIADHVRASNEGAAKGLGQ